MKELDGEFKPTEPEMSEGALKVVDHFTKDLDEAAKDYTVPCPEWCAELYDVQEQIKKLQDREARLKEVAKNFKDRGDFAHGGYILTVKERAGSKTLDKDALLARLEAELGAEEAKVYADACTKQGKPSLVVTVKKLTASSGTVPGGSGESGL